MACLRRTFASEIAAGRVVLVQEGVWSAEGRLVFQDAGFSDASFVDAEFIKASPSVTRVGVPVTPIDSLVDRLELDRVDLIKMDIEGSEQEALKGAARTLARFKPRLAIAGYHKPSDPERIPAIVRGANPAYRFTSAGCRLDMPQIRPLTLFFF
jgi:FkbM family methyltransferase